MNVFLWGFRSKVCEVQNSQSDVGGQHLAKGGAGKVSADQFNDSILKNDFYFFYFLKASGCLVLVTTNKRCFSYFHFKTERGFHHQAHCDSA